MSEKCNVCGQFFELARIKTEGGWCNFCHQTYVQRKDNYGTPRMEYINKLQGVDEKELVAECGKMIYMSAFTNNNPRSDWHWKADACYNECTRRAQPLIYDLAHERFVKEYS